MDQEQGEASCWANFANGTWFLLSPLRWFLARAHYVLLPFVHLYTMVKMLGDEKKNALVSALPMLLMFTSLLLFLITATQNSDLDLSNMNHLNKNELADYVYNNADETMKSTMDALLNADTPGSTYTQIILDAAGETEIGSAFDHLNDTPEFRENQKELNATSNIQRSNLATAGTITGALGFVGRLLDNQIEKGKDTSTKSSYDWSGLALLNICCLLLMLAPIFIGLVYASGCGIADYGVGEGGVFMDKQFHDVMLYVAPIWCVTLLFIGLVCEGIHCDETQKNLSSAQKFLEQEQLVGNEITPFGRTINEVEKMRTESTDNGLEQSERSESGTVSTSDRLRPDTSTHTSSTTEQSTPKVLVSDAEHLKGTTHSPGCPVTRTLVD